MGAPRLGERYGLEPFGEERCLHLPLLVEVDIDVALDDPLGVAVVSR